MHVDRALHDIFIDEGYVTAEVVEKVLAERDDQSESLGDALFRLGYVTISQKLKCVALQTGIPFFDIRSASLDPEVVMRVPQKMAVRCRAIIVEASETAASVAMADPLNLDLIDEIGAHLDLDIDPMWAVDAEITERIVEVYGGYNDLEDILGAASREIETSGLELSSGAEEESDKVVSLADVSEGSPVVQFVNALFARAIKMGASDIHIEPRAKLVRVRFRIDGMLRDMMDVPREIHRAVVSRIKVISGLDIAERRVPQDGRCSMVSTEGEFDFRVATYPTVNGEKVTIRVLDKRSGIRDVSGLGIFEGALKTLLHAVDQSQGLVLVTGPTGSGKTTTLYSLLAYVNRGDRQVITIEDPVEYQLEGIVQGNVNVLAGLTFASGLRAMLRADPDVILVGESRDPETAKTSIEAALTGHLVMTSLHANDSASAVTRLIDMGVEPFLVGASVSCAVAQRLVRTNCQSCLESYSPDEEMLLRLGMPLDHDYKRGKGCDKCGGSGYKGRAGVYEVLNVNSSVRRMILANAPATEIRATAVQDGMKTMYMDACDKVLANLTTLDEVARVIAAEDDQ